MRSSAVGGAAGSDEPRPWDPDWPRYARHPFPAYRYVPGATPHPRLDPRGHAYGEAEPSPPPLRPTAWRESDAYLFAVDLHNFAYWWESHEHFEGLWRAAGRDTPLGGFLRALVLLGAVELKNFCGVDRASRRFAESASDLLAGYSGHFLGIDVPDLRDRLAHRVAGSAVEPLLIRLHFEDDVGN